MPIGTLDELRPVSSENPIKEIWSRLGYFKNEQQVQYYFFKLFNLSLANRYFTQILNKNS